MRSPLVSVGVLLLPLLSADASAQDVRHELARWSADHGPGWRSFLDSETGQVEFLGGGSVAAAFEPRTEADYLELARESIEATAHLTGLESATLVSPELRHVPLTQIGTTNKLVVRFGQELDGVPVFGARVNVLLDIDGRLLSVQSTAMPGLTGTPTSVLFAAEQARERAAAAFQSRLGLPPTSVREPELGIAQHVVDGRRFAALAWRVDVLWQMAATEPEGTTYLIDARAGSVIEERPLVHHLDVGGTVLSNATPGTAPDTGSNPPQASPLSYLQVSSSAGTVFTDVNGGFNFPGVSGPLDCTFEYVGSFAEVVDVAGSDHVVNETLSGTGNTVLMNPSPTELLTSQANAFREIGVLRDWIRAVDAGDDTADFQARAKCNIDQNCNAYWDGSSVNFFTSGGPCVNTAYSTVVAHEMGHWLNQRYGTGNGGDGMGEGNADVFAMYLYDTAVVGQGFFGPGSHVRSGWNGRSFCGDCSPGCYGEVHADGEVWMGAAWKVRNHLNSTNGDALGDAIADAIFSGWMNAYDQNRIKSVIELQWLTLDDDNANLDDGTPHFADIDQGFRDQGFPGLTLPDILFANVTERADTLDELGPYTVDATVTGAANPPITSVDLAYRVDADVWITVPMTSTGGDDYTAEIPGQAAPAEVQYVISATDASGTTEVYPRDADRPFEFSVGVVALFFDDFEQFGSGGWEHGAIAGNDDWHHEPPNCAAGDATSAYSGTRLRGNDLGRPGFDGFYDANTHNWLLSPFIDCADAVDTRLRFRRWLTLESNDRARIFVNGVVAWESGSTDTSDTSWELFIVDISGVADGNPNVQIRFELETDGANQRGGWNIDDFAVVHRDYDCATPTTYGQAKVDSGGGLPQIGSSGTPTASLSNFQITLIDGIPNQLALLFSGDAPDNTPFLGGTRLVLPPLTRDAQLSLDLFGDGDVPIDVLPSMVGTTRYYQFWMRDPQHPDGTGAGLTNGLEVTYCE